jgi:hypothetical protein
MTLTDMQGKVIIQGVYIYIYSEESEIQKGS